MVLLFYLSESGFTGLKDFQDRSYIVKYLRQPHTLRSSGAKGRIPQS